MSKVIGEGDKAPDFSLATDSGGKISLKEFAGHPLVLYFYPKDDTAGCTKEALAFTAAAPKFKKLGVPVIGMSKDNVASHDRFKAKHKLNFTLASDPDGSVIESYGSWVEKSMYGRKYMGIDRSTFIVDSKGRIVKIWRKVKVLGHAEEVLAVLKVL